MWSSNLLEHFISIMYATMANKNYFQKSEWKYLETVLVNADIWMIMMTLNYQVQG